jgi:curli biogenesis system outer membrane secretion channel CsgG
MKLQTVSTVLLACAAFSLNTGCASRGSSASLTNTSTALDSPVFIAPFDPGMGQIVVAVPEVRVSAPQGDRHGDLGQAVRSQMVATLSASQNFMVADRESMDDIADEHRLADAGATVEADRPEAGQLAGARYLIRVDVTEFQESVVASSTGGGVSIGGVFRLLDNFVDGSGYRTVSDVAKAADPTVAAADQTVEGVVGMEVRVVDVQSGTVVATTRAHGKLERKGGKRAFGIAGFEFGGSEFEQTVLAQATRIACEQAANNVHSALKRVVLATPERSGLAAR